MIKKWKIFQVLFLKKARKADLAFKSSVSHRRCRVDHSSGLLRLVDDNCLMMETVTVSYVKKGCEVKTTQSMLIVNAVDYAAVISVVM